MFNILDNRKKEWQANVMPREESPIKHAPPAAPDAIRQAWQGHLGGIEQFSRPIDAPWEGGTPTQRRRDAEEAKRQFDEEMAWQREQFAAQQALARAAAAGGSGGDPGRRQQLTDMVYELAQTAINQGLPLSTVRNQIKRNQSLWGPDMSEDDALRLAQSFYEGKMTPQDFAGGVQVGSLPSTPLPFNTGYEMATDRLTGVKRDRLYDAALQDLQRFVKPPELPDMQKLDMGSAYLRPDGSAFRVDYDGVTPFNLGGFIPK